MMKLVSRLIVGAVVLGAIIWGGVFFYNNLRGVAPAISPPVRDITREIPETPVEQNTTGLPLTLPSGFSISIFAKDLGGPRVLAWDPAGTLLVSIPSQGKVVALPDENGDGIADEAIPVVSGLNRPHGLAFSPGSDLKVPQGLTPTELFIAETDQVAVYSYDPQTHKATNKRRIVDLPSGGNHVTRTIGFGPDGRLYIAVGSSCNVCIEKDSRRTKILTVDVGYPDGANQQDNRGLTPIVYASGLRNPVFFTWHPVTRELWATEMGRDLIGDDIPPDEINIVKEGKFYGWPYCYGKNVHDTTFDASENARKICLGAEQSHVDLQAHSAPLGLAFIPQSWPAEYQGDLLVAFHGSWNRTEPTGYKVVRIKLDERGNYQSTEDFITGWFTPARGLTPDGALGRPVDLLFDPQGILYFSDDKAGVIYRTMTTQR